MKLNLPRVKNKSETNNLVRRHYLDRLVDDFFDFEPFYLSTSEDLVPRTDISETDSEYHLEVELPGVQEKNVELKVDNHTLTIKGHKEGESEDRGKNYHMRERYYGSFQRSINLPSNINQDSIEAHFKNGILSIIIPKKEQGKAKQIKIKS